jgi:hypothetical protein
MKRTHPLPSPAPPTARIRTLFPDTLLLSTIMDSLFPPSKPRLEQNLPRFLKMRVPAAGWTGGIWNCGKPLFIGLTPGVADPLAGPPFAYKYSARSTESAYTSPHFAARLGRACLGKARALPKQTRPKSPCTRMSVHARFGRVC